MGKHKLTQEEVSLRAKKFNVEFLETYQGNKIKISTKCLLCYHVWSIIPNNLFHGTKCPRCKGKEGPVREELKGGKYLTDKQVNLKLPDNIKIVEYNGLNKQSLINCLLCGFEWPAFPNSLIRSHEKNNTVICKRCNNSIIENDKFSHIINSMSLSCDILPINSYVKKEFTCKLCGEKINTNIADINTGIGCTVCESNLINRINKYTWYAKMNNIKYYYHEHHPYDIEKMFRFPEKKKVKENVWTCEVGHNVRKIDLKKVKKGNWCMICLTKLEGGLVFMERKCDTKLLYDIAFEKRVIKKPGIFIGLHENHYWECSRGHPIGETVYNYITGDWRGCTFCADYGNDFNREIGDRVKKLRETCDVLERDIDSFIDAGAPDLWSEYIPHMCKNNFSDKRIKEGVRLKILPLDFPEISKGRCCGDKLELKYRKLWSRVILEEEYRKEQKDASEMNMSWSNYIKIQEEMYRNISDLAFDRWWGNRMSKLNIINLEEEKSIIVN